MESIRAAWQARPTLAVELENKGSVARDHLAGERTYLAWLRTALALASLGVAIAQLFKLPELSESTSNSNVSGAYSSSSSVDQLIFSSSSGDRLQSLEKLGRPLGATCIGLGAVCLLMGCYRYFLVQSHLMRGQFPPSRVEISFMTLGVGALIVASFGVIVGTNLSS